MDDPKPGRFALNRGRVVILVLGLVAAVIAISTSMGGITAYQQLREANAAATSTPADAPTSPQ